MALLGIDVAIHFYEFLILTFIIGINFYSIICKFSCFFRYSIIGEFGEREEIIMKRINVFDWMRAAVALFVIIYHYTTRYSELIGHLDNYPINFTYGYMGVTVFFVLSGFLTVYHMRDKNGG